MRLLAAWLLLFGVVQGAVDADLVTKLPGFDGELPSKHYSGCELLIHNNIAKPSTFPWEKEHFPQLDERERTFFVHDIKVIHPPTPASWFLSFCKHSKLKNLPAQISQWVRFLVVLDSCTTG